MNKEELAPWIERMNAEPDGKKRNAIVAELCKEKGMKIGDAWKLIKEAGFDPKAVPGNSEAADNTAPDGSAANPQTPEETEAKATLPGVKAESILIRHKTQYAKYRCAGLVLTQKPETYQVTKSQLEILRRDPWVVIEKESAPK
jgi:hypothetical protein